MERKRGGPGCSLGSARRVQRTRSLLLTARGSPETSAPPQWTVPVNADAPLLARLRVSLTLCPQSFECSPSPHAGRVRSTGGGWGGHPLDELSANRLFAYDAQELWKGEATPVPLTQGLLLETERTRKARQRGREERRRKRGCWSARRRDLKPRLVRNTAGVQQRRGQAEPGRWCRAPAPRPRSVCEGLRGRVPGPPARRPTALLRALRQETPR